MLAFVVLYNLNNINITERQRELATLKVLGFFDIEVSQYVLRENIILTIAGILFGAEIHGVMGVCCHTLESKQQGGTQGHYIRVTSP